MKQIKFIAPLGLITAIGTTTCMSDTVLIPANSPAIHVSDYVVKELVHMPDNDPAISFNRTIDLTRKGYGWDSPGTRISFRTNATHLAAILYYSSKHISTSGRNSIGIYRIDGQSDPACKFQTCASSIIREPETIEVLLNDSNRTDFHDYELILPYADSVEFAGLKTNPEAEFEPFNDLRSIRYVAYGDSITQGFTASSIENTYSFKLANSKGWILLNCGFGGRSSNAADGDLIVKRQPHIVTLLIGVNDWQAGISIAQFHKNIQATLDSIRRGCPDVPVYVITPLWVPARWEPQKAILPLEDYRQALREIVSAKNDPNLHLVEGPSLIDHDEHNFDEIAVHPNDDGFAMMAERLAAIVQAEPRLPTPARKHLPEKSR